MGDGRREDVRVDEGNGATRADGDVVARAMAGDRRSFALLVHEHGRALHAYLARRAGHQVADDLLTEVWLRAWRSRGSYDTGWSDPRPWLYGIARNVLRGHWRLRVDHPGPTFQFAEDPWPAVDDRLAASRLGHVLEAALAELGEELRDVILLVAWEQLTPAEVAVVLGIPPGTVRSRLHRARQALQRAVDAADSPNPDPHPNYQEA